MRGYRTEIEQPAVMLLPSRSAGVAPRQPLPEAAVVSDYTALISGSTITGVTGRAAFYSYSFPTAVPLYVGDYYPDGLETFRVMTDAEKALAREALSDWAAVSGLTFFEVAPGDGDIKFMVYEFDDLGSDAAGFAYYPGGTDGSAIYSDVFIDDEWADWSHLYYHEIGHALGLKHPFDGTTTLDPSLDIWGHTVMSYTSGGVAGDTLGNLDLDAIRSLYGGSSADGSQVASWRWDAATKTLHQEGFASTESIGGIGGRDSIHGNSGDDTISGREGADTLFGDAGADILDGGDGNDRIEGGADRDNLSGEDGNDVLIGGTADDSLYGQGGDDTVDGGTDRDTLYGGDGDDTLCGGTEDDTLYGDAGDDRLYGGDGADYLAGTAGFDILYGGAGSDRLSLDAGGGTANGGDGDDTLSLSFERGVALTLSGGAGVDRLSLSLGTNTAFDFVTWITAIALSTIEEVTITAGAGEFRDRIVGGDLRDEIYAGDGDNVVTGGRGDDVIQAGMGDDRLEGGDGDDRLFAGDGRNIIDGGSGNDSLYGGAGVDTITAGDDADYANGSAGDDWVAGGEGADSLYGGEGVDTLSFAGEASAVTVTINVARYIAALAAWEYLGDFENMVGTRFADSLTGDGAGNTLDGGKGDDALRGLDGGDVLRGGLGADVLAGGMGDDRIDGGAGRDLANFADAGAAITISLARTGKQVTGEGRDTIIGVEDVTGSRFDDRLTGNAGANTISGGFGNDRLTGGGGIDVLNGGAGNDRFVFATGDSGATKRTADMIDGFDRAIDRIDLLAIDAVSGTTKDDAFIFIGTAGFGGVAGQLRVDTQRGGTFVISGDTDGDAVADFMIVGTGQAPEAREFYL